MSQRSIEAFLEDAFASVTKPASSAVGRVTVEPNDAAILNEAERTGLAEELVRCILRETAKPSVDLRSQQGHDIPLYPLLNKYLRAITLYGDTAMGAWVQVLPRGDFLNH
jgi:hypothetical protein